MSCNACPGHGQILCVRARDLNDMMLKESWEIDGWIEKSEISVFVVHGVFLFAFLVESFEFANELSFGLHNIGFFSATLGTKPFAFGFRGQIHAIEMEPFQRTKIVVAPDHLAVRNLKKQKCIRIEHRRI